MIKILDISINDRIYVYKKKLLDGEFGIVKNILQRVIEDALGMQFLEYKIEVILESGKEVKLKSDSIFRKYNFISEKEFKEEINRNQQE